MQDNVHELIKIKPMKVKDYKPLYKTLLSVMNFHDTKTTGYIIKEL